MEQTKQSGFALGAVFLGVLSVCSLCTGILPIFIASLGFLFIAMNHRHNQPLSNSIKFAIGLNTIGLILGICLTVYVVVFVMLPMLTDPAYFEELNTFYLRNYGVSLEELLGTPQLP